MLIGLYGAGTLGRRIGRSLEQQFVFIDDTPAKAGMVMDEHEVIPLAEFARRADGTDARIYICIYQPGFVFERKKHEVAAAHPAIECRPFTQLLLNQAAGALPFLFFERPDRLAAKLERYRGLRRVLADDRSRATLDGHLRLRQSGCFDEIVWTSRRDLPFLLDRLPADVEYIDAGAFDGDTAEDFIEMTRGRFRSIRLVEPDPGPMPLAERRMAMLGMAERVMVRPEAIAAERGWAGFDCSGTVGSSLDPAAKHKVATVTLSDYERGNPLYFKLDIEGSEVAAIRASLDFIAERRVLLAVSVYHSPDDLLAVASMIPGLHAGYELFLRCHGSGGEDLMLYALPNCALEGPPPVRR
ncbi:MAG: FkbM family methyltransferase [Steroidobacteraceae bacterium]